MRRRVHRADGNSADLVKAARKLGMLVKLIGRPTDAFVCIDGVWFPTEFKSAHGTYTPEQLEFQTECAQHNAPMLTWRTAQDIIDCANGVVGAEG